MGEELDELMKGSSHTLGTYIDNLVPVKTFKEIHSNKKVCM